MSLTVMSPATKPFIESTAIPKPPIEGGGSITVIVARPQQPNGEQSTTHSLSTSTVPTGTRVARSSPAPASCSTSGSTSSRPPSVKRRPTLWVESAPSAIERPRITTTRADALLPWAVSVTRARIGLKMSVAFNATLVENDPFGWIGTATPFTVSVACAGGCCSRSRSR